MKKKKQKTFTEQVRENPYIMSTIALAICVLIFLTAEIIESDNRIENNQTNLCDILYATPAWIVEGKFLDYGYKGNVSVDGLMENKIEFYYKEGCSYCQQQIKDFDNWTKYKDSGLTKKCG